MSIPLVSVGIPFLNCEECLLNSVRSIFAQTYTNWELILVDDGSTDRSLDIARSIDDPRVRVLPPDGKNRRLPARLNQITGAAKGDYIARMDADDMCHPERLARQVEFLQAHPDVDVVGTSSCILGHNQQPAATLIVAQTHEEIFKDKFKSGISIVHPSIMGKAEWFCKWSYDENNIRCEDYELWMRSCKNSVFANIPDILYFTNEFCSYALSKYAKSKHTGAKVIWRHAPAEIGRFAAAYYAGRRYLQIGLYVGAKILGLHDKLISRRYSPITTKEKSQISAVLGSIRKTEVPIRCKENV